MLTAYKLEGKGRDNNQCIHPTRQNSWRALYEWYLWKRFTTVNLRSKEQAIQIYIGYTAQRMTPAKTSLLQKSDNSMIDDWNTIATLDEDNINAEISCWRPYMR